MLDSPARPEASGALTWRILLALAAVLATTLLCLQSEMRWPAVISALGVAVLLVDGPLLDQFLQRRSWVCVFLALCWAGLVTGFLLHDNLKAQWGLIDDPEIAGFLGTDGRISVSDWASALAHFREV